MADAHRYRASILTVSDSSFNGTRSDASGPRIKEMLTASGFEIISVDVVPDVGHQIVNRLMSMARSTDLIITTGGTGFSPRDVTPEATLQVISRQCQGLAEYIRWKGYQQNARAALSRGIAGICGNCLIINLPGSPKAVTEGVEAIQDIIEHALALIKSDPVDH